jgi:hypothetical protein
MVQRGGSLVLKALNSVRRPTISLHIKHHVAMQSTVYTDEYDTTMILLPGAMNIRRYAILMDSMLVMAMAMILPKFISTLKKEFGQFYVLGCAHTAV